jgi:tetratricopeptide (TPR) repeat protein
MNEKLNMITKAVWRSSVSPWERFGAGLRAGFLLLLLPVVFAQSAYCQQRSLQAEDKSGPFDVFTGVGTEAGMVVICNENIELAFVSNRDATVNVFRVETKGSDRYYYLRMPTGEAYNDRRLTIHAARYAPLIIEPRLQTKELKTFHLFDPDVILQGCYNQIMKEGLEIFRMAQYVDARAKYRLAVECSDAPASVFDDVAEIIATIDTIIRRRRLADEFFTIGNYQKAYNHYMAVFSYNPNDRYAELRMSESRLRIGSAGFSENTDNKDRKRQRTFVMAYETPTGNIWGSHGGSLGWYRDRKVGVCFAARTAVENLYYKNMNVEIPEFSASMGLTFRLFRLTKKDYRKWPWGVWASLGGSYAIASVNNKQSSGSSERLASWAPEAGLLMKMGFLTVKYTYQHRIDFPDDFDGRSFIGLGLCF